MRGDQRRVRDRTPDPLDEAIKAATAARSAASPRLGKIDEIPYDFERRRLTVVVGAPTAAAR